MLRRIFTAVPALLLLAAVIYFYGYYFLAVFGMLALVAEYEIISAVKKNGVRPFDALLYIATALVVPIYIFWDIAGLVALFTVFVISVCVAGITRKELAFKRIALTISVFVYPQMFFMFLYAIASMDNVALSQMLMIYLFAVAILTDTFAYFFGITFGKKKLAPVISPNKTVAGAVGGILGGMIAAVLTGLLVQGWFHINIGILHFLFSGFLMAVLSEYGDLMASLIKREYSLKDYGNILPGHGGIMDRLDSILFISPILYFYFTQIPL
jgi:phosphatidate cytidylyltransferase